MLQIADLDLSGSQSAINVTTHSLRKCKKQILIPYDRLIKLVRIVEASTDRVLVY